MFRRQFWRPPSRERWELLGQIGPKKELCDNLSHTKHVLLNCFRAFSHYHLFNKHLLGTAPQTGCKEVKEKEDRAPAFGVLTILRGRQLSKHEIITQFSKYHDGCMQSAVRAREDGYLMDRVSGKQQRKCTGIDYVMERWRTAATITMHLADLQLQQHFSTSALLVFWTRSFCVVGAILCILSS